MNINAWGYASQHWDYKKPTTSIKVNLSEKRTPQNEMKSRGNGIKKKFTVILIITIVDCEWTSQIIDESEVPGFDAKEQSSMFFFLKA